MPVLLHCLLQVRIVRKTAYLALGVVEVGGDGDDGALDLAALAHERLRDVAHLGQDHAADLLRGEALLLALELHCAQHMLLSNMR